MATPFDVAGAIRIRLQTHRDRVMHVTLDTSRPMNPTEHLFAGVEVDDAISILPTLFSVCSSAQGLAMVNACERASNTEPAPPQVKARQLLLLIETAREHLFRILVGWRQWFGEAPAQEPLRVIGRLRDAWKTALYPDGDVLRRGGGRLRPNARVLDTEAELLQTIIADVLGWSPADWSALDDLPALADWAASEQALAQRMIQAVTTQEWAELGRSDVDVLPDLPATRLGRLLIEDDDGGFRSRPVWQGQPHETGALERHMQRPLIRALHRRYGNGLLSRLTARLLELATVPDQIARLRQGLRPSEPALPAGRTGERSSGSGLAQVHAARGRLLHWVGLEQGRVTAHRMLAPTEWNFHPQGALARGLIGLPAGEHLSRQARLLVDAIDPCVQYTIDVDADA